MIWSTDFAGPVCAGISAPFDATNSNNLWGWSAQEKTGLHPAPGDFDWWQWCNALNTTEKWAGSIDVGAQPGPHDVQEYLSISDGCAATVATLLNGRYPDIVQALRDSLPASQWGAAARAQLDIWGTGSSWCDFVPVGVEMLDPNDPIVVEMRRDLDALAKAAFFGTGTPNADPTANTTQWGDVHGYAALFEARMKAILPAGSVTVDNAAVLAAIADLKAHPTVASDPVLLGKLSAIEANLNAPRPPA
jgi:hypothetical protein